jgi:hypothetical protein
MVSVIGPRQTAVERGLLDTGADDTVFPESVAARIGVDLTNAPTGELFAAGSVPVIVRYALVNLRITDGHEFREWPAWVGFTASWLKQPLLGFAGFLQFFTAVFRGKEQEVELEVNSLYPGT